MLDTGVILSKKAWNKSVKTVVDNIQVQKWIAKCNLYRTLETVMKIVKKIEMNVWWVDTTHGYVKAVSL